MSRFWTQFEAWLSFMQGTANGLAGAPASSRRGHVRCIHNARASEHEHVTSLTEMWAGKTAKDAKEILSKPDVTVTNARDKSIQLRKILKFDAAVRESFATDEEASLSRRISLVQSIKSVRRRATSRLPRRSRGLVAALQAMFPRRSRQPSSLESVVEKAKADAPRDSLSSEGSTSTSQVAAAQNQKPRRPRLRARFPRAWRAPRPSQEAVADS